MALITRVRVVAYSTANIERRQQGLEDYNVESVLTEITYVEGAIFVECLGCRIANGLEPNLNIIYENERITCVLDIAPFNEGHTLILPKKHYLDVDEIDQETAYSIMDASKLISFVLKSVYKPDGIRVSQDGGKFNDLTHYHMHLIPRYEGDGFTWGEPLVTGGAENRLPQTREKLIKVVSELL